MKGVLEKTFKGWVVNAWAGEGEEVSFIKSYPLHEADSNQLDEIDAGFFGVHGDVEFELVMGYDSVFKTTQPFAKIWYPMLGRLKQHLGSITLEQFEAEINAIIKNDTSVMLVCDECGMEECDCGLTPDEEIIRDNHRSMLLFAAWFKESDWDCFDNTDRGNVYANTLVTDTLLTIEEIYELYLKEQHDNTH